MKRTSKKDVLATLAVLLVVFIVVTSSVTFNKKKPIGNVASASTTVAFAVEKDDDTQPPMPAAATPPATTAPTPAPAPAVVTQPYKDGGYSATGSYSTPESTENITINITLKGGTVTATSASATPHSRESKQYINAFIRNYQPSVVGKSIASLKLSRVSGSSLTPIGFNKAIEQIKAQAKS